MTQIKRYIRLTHLIPKMRDMVDKEILAIRSAVEISFLSEDEQYPYLGTREKEDAFLERVETAIRDGVKESVPMAIAKNLMEMLVPFVKESVGENNLSDRIRTMEKTNGEIAEDNLYWEKEADMDAALDFADSF